MANKEKYVLSKRAFLGHCVMCIVQQAPANMPRKIEKIIYELNKYFRENTRMFALDKFGNQIPETSDFINYPTMAEDEIKKLVDNIVSIKEIEELNLSNNEYKNNVTVDDENRPKFTFYDRYSKEDDDNDFIDLDALTRNIFNGLMHELIEDKEWLENE